MNDNEIDLQLDKAAAELAERRALWARHKAELLPMIRAMQKLNPTVRLSGEIDIHIAGDVHVLTAAVRVLRTHGFITCNSPPKKGDSIWSAFFQRGDCPLQVWFKFASTVCRRVKIGTEMVEQDVFETVCDEFMLPESEVA